MAPHSSTLAWNEVESIPPPNRKKALIVGKAITAL